MMLLLKTEYHPLNFESANIAKFLFEFIAFGPTASKMEDHNTDAAANIFGNFMKTKPRFDDMGKPG